jgi:hypothetical protein
MLQTNLAIQLMRENNMPMEGGKKHEALLMREKQ